MDDHLPSGEVDEPILRDVGARVVVSLLPIADLRRLCDFDDQQSARRLARVDVLDCQRCTEAGRSAEAVAGTSRKS